MVQLTDALYNEKIPKLIRDLQDSIQEVEDLKSPSEIQETWANELAEAIEALENITKRPQ